MITTTTEMPLAKMILVYLATLIAGNVLAILIETFLPNLSLPGSIGIVFAMVASMTAGGTAATALGRSLVSREKLVFAVVATVTSLILTLLLVWGLFAWNGAPLTTTNLVVAMTGDPANTEEIAALLPWILLAGTVLSLLICYFAVGFGAKNQLRALERKAAKRK